MLGARRQPLALLISVPTLEPSAEPLRQDQPRPQHRALRQKPSPLCPGCRRPASAPSPLRSRPRRPVLYAQAPASAPVHRELRPLPLALVIAIVEHRCAFRVQPKAILLSRSLSINCASGEDHRPKGHPYFTTPVEPVCSASFPATGACQGSTLPHTFNKFGGLRYLGRLSSTSRLAHTASSSGFILAVPSSIMVVKSLAQSMFTGGTESLWGFNPQHYMAELINPKYYLEGPGSWINYPVGDFLVANVDKLVKVKFSMTQIDCTHTRGGLFVRLKYCI